MHASDVVVREAPRFQYHAFYRAVRKWHRFLRHWTGRNKGNLKAYFAPPWIPYALELSSTDKYIPEFHRQAYQVSSICASCEFSPKQVRNYVRNYLKEE